MYVSTWDQILYLLGELSHLSLFTMYLMKKKAQPAKISSIETVSSLAGYHIKVNPVSLNNLVVLPSLLTKNVYTLQ